MEEKIEKSNPFIYLPLFALSAALVFWAFVSFFKLGREEAKKEPPKPAGEQAGAQAVDLSLLYNPTPELAAEGKMLYAVNCASCHGPTGKGDGDRAPELNPRPRNYATEKFKFGNSPSQLWNTLRVGSPGTAMAPFELLPAKDRIAIIHYIRTLIPNPANDTKEVAAQLTGGGAAPTSGGATATAADTAKAGPRIPIVLALRASARPEGPVGRKLSRLPPGLGRETYVQRCASCHGASGEGGEPVQKLAVFPYRYAKAPTLQNPNAVWVRNKKEFEKIVVGGLPGKLMPGELLTEPELDALYRFVVELAKER
ncbi:MAG: cytochrome c [candidate division Zixibacteria bacterium]|nr:cytochrome c [candidate division Zixibacteria bacterium]